MAQQAAREAEREIQIGEDSLKKIEIALKKENQDRGREEETRRETERVLRVDLEKYICKSDELDGTIKNLVLELHTHKIKVL